ncbi:MAG TPA: hypothetical protein VF071_06310 [Candidatus Limnocylindria bacterium]
MFGRRRQQQQREEEAAREAERRALFEELAKRPDTICPFLGLEDARTEYRDRVSESHRCYAFGDPAELSAEQQQKVCLQRGYGNCPRYLRGVLVIPTEELEALRRPQPAPPPPTAPPPPPAPVPAAAGGGGGRGLLAVVLVLLLTVGVGAVTFIALNADGGVGQQSPSPSASLQPTPSESALASDPAASGTQEPTATPVPTPVVVPSGTALPTPGPDDVFTGYAIRVDAGTYDVVDMDEDGNISGPARAGFDGGSWAPVERFEIDGTTYWRTSIGGYRGLAYSRSLDDRFVIFETYETAEGEPRFLELDPSDY